MSGDALLAGARGRSAASSTGAALADHEVHVAEELVGEEESETLPQRALGGLPVVQRLPLQHRAGLRSGGRAGSSGGGGRCLRGRTGAATGSRHRRPEGPGQAAPGGSAGRRHAQPRRQTLPAHAPLPRAGS